jgi:hypothetical protein
MDLLTNQTLMDIARFSGELDGVLAELRMQTACVAFISCLTVLVLVWIARRHGSYRIAGVLLAMAVIAPCLSIATGRFASARDRNVRTAIASTQVACSTLEDVIGSGKVKSMTEDQVRTAIKGCGNKALVAASTEPGSHVSVVSRTQRDGIDVPLYWVTVPRAPWRQDPEPRPIHTRRHP